MKKPPEGWPQISSSLFYDDAAAAIPWLCNAFGFEVKLKVEGEGGRIEHSELVFGEGMIMVSEAGGKSSRPKPLPCASPRSLNNQNTQVLCVFVDDVDAHCEHARKAGAKIVDEPSTSDYGDDYWSDRSYRTEDVEGHTWWFMQRLRGPKPKA
ncbi:MAG: Glyoxalase family protein [Myxococcaceae bacterium]|nr:Glyoxalase family protein [Myxococcaceae bacterium]